jgi:hypothetical protein
VRCAVRGVAGVDRTAVEFLRCAMDAVDMGGSNWDLLSCRYQVGAVGLARLASASEGSHRAMERNGSWGSGHLLAKLSARSWRIRELVWEILLVLTSDTSELMGEC